MREYILLHIRDLPVHCTTIISPITLFTKPRIVLIKSNSCHDTDNNNSNILIPESPSVIISDHFIIHYYIIICDNLVSFFYLLVLLILSSVAFNLPPSIVRSSSLFCSCRVNVAVNCSTCEACSLPCFEPVLSSRLCAGYR